MYFFTFTFFLLFPLRFFPLIFFSPSPPPFWTSGYAKTLCHFIAYGYPTSIFSHFFSLLNGRIFCRCPECSLDGDFMYLF